MELLLPNSYLTEPRSNGLAYVKPDVEHLERRIQQAAIRDGSFVNQCYAIDEMVFRTYPVNIPKAFQKTTRVVHVPIIEDVFRRVWAELIRDYPSVSQVPLSDHPRTQQRSNKLEAWSTSFIPASEAALDRTVFFHLVWDVIAYGVAYGQCELWMDAWDNYNRQMQSSTYKKIVDEKSGLSREETADEKSDRLLPLKREKLPWRVKDLDPRTVHVWRDEDGIAEVLIEVERERIDLQNQYGELKPNSLGIGMLVDGYGNAMSGTGQKTKFWTHYSRECVTYYAERQILKQREHGYGHPLVWEARGLSTPSHDPVKAFRSIAAPVFDMIKGLDWLLTVELNTAVISGMPMGQHVLPADTPEANLAEDGKPKAPIEFSPGQFVTTPGRYEWIGMPDVGPAMHNIVSTYIRIINETGSLPPVVRGLAQGPDQTGYAIRQLMDAAASIFQPLLAGIGKLYEGMFRYIYWSIEEKIREPVYLIGADPRDDDKKKEIWLGLGPNDIRGYHKVKVEFKSAGSIRDAATQRLGLDLAGAGKLDDITLYEEYLGFTDGQRIVDRVNVQRLTNSDEVQAAVLKEIMRDWAEQMNPTPEEVPPTEAPPGVPGTPNEGAYAPGNEGGLPSPTTWEPDQATAPLVGALNSPNPPGLASRGPIPGMPQMPANADDMAQRAGNI